MPFESSSSFTAIMCEFYLRVIRKRPSAGAAAFSPLQETVFYPPERDRTSHDPPIWIFPNSVAYDPVTRLRLAVLRRNRFAATAISRSMNGAPLVRFESGQFDFSKSSCSADKRPRGFNSPLTMIVFICKSERAYFCATSHAHSH